MDDEKLVEGVTNILEAQGLRFFVAVCRNREDGFYVNHNLAELDPVVHLPSGEVISSEKDFLNMVECLCEEGFNSVD